MLVLPHNVSQWSLTLVGVGVTAAAKLAAFFGIDASKPGAASSVASVATQLAQLKEIKAAGGNRLAALVALSLR